MSSATVRSESLGKVLLQVSTASVKTLVVVSKEPHLVLRVSEVRILLLRELVSAESRKAKTQRESKVKELMPAAFSSVLALRELACLALL